MSTKVQDDEFETVHETSPVTIGGHPVTRKTIEAGVASIVGMSDQECKAQGIPLVPVPTVQNDEDYRKVGAGKVEPQFGVPGNRLTDAIQAERIVPFEREACVTHPGELPEEPYGKVPYRPVIRDEDLKEAREDGWYAAYCMAYALCCNGSFERNDIDQTKQQPIETFVAWALAAEDEATEVSLKTRDELVQAVKRKLGRLG